MLLLVFVCATFGQTTLNMSQDLLRLGIASTNMVPNQPGQDAGPLFFRAVNYAQSHQIGRVIADRGAYYFKTLQTPTSHVQWLQLSNLTIDLQSSDLYFSFPFVTGLQINNGTNVVLQNFSADYDPLPFTQVRVQSVDAAQRRVQFAVDGSWQNPTVLNQVFPSQVQIHLFRNGYPIPGMGRLLATNPIGANQFTIKADPSGFATSAVLAQIRPGDVAYLGGFVAGGPVTSYFCMGCTFRNIVAYTGGYYGVLAAFSQSSVFERIYTMLRPGTDRLASTYIGVMTLGAGPNNQIRLNRSIRTLDNSFENSVAVLGTVRSQTDSRTLVVEGTLTSQLSYGNAVPNGTPVAFQRISDGAVLAIAAVASQVAPPFGSQQPYRATFTFDRGLPANLVGTIMFGTDPSQRGGNTVVERNAVEEQTDCCGGIWISGFVNSAVRGNYIRKTAMAAIHAENSMIPNDYNAPPSENLTTRNNVIDGPNWTPSSQRDLLLGAVAVTARSVALPGSGSSNQNITISNNFIADSGSAAVWMGNTNNGSVAGNYFVNANNNPALEAALGQVGIQQPLVVHSSQNIVTSNNVIDQTSRRMWVTDGQNRELAAYAPGSTIRLNAYGLATLFPSPSVTLTDSDGNTFSLVPRIVNAHAIDVDLPSSVALGGAYLNLASGSVKYFGTLFLDGVDNIPALNGCTYEVSPSSTSIGAGAGNLPILVVTQTGCSYQVLVASSFVNPGAGGAGTNVVSAGLAANTGAARTASIEVAGQAFTVTQDAPGLSKLTASIKAVAGNGQSGPAGFLLSAPVVVQVTDNAGNPVSRTTVTFAGTNAVISPAVVQTD